MNIKDFFNQDDFMKLHNLNTETALIAKKNRHKDFESFKKAYDNANSQGFKVTPRNNPLQLCLGFLVIEEDGIPKKITHPDPIEGADLRTDLPPLPKITWHLVGLSHYKKAMKNK